jgi:hypothetical protein
VPLRRGAVVRTMKEALDYWLEYRDEVALHCGLDRDGRGRDPRAA